jgi:hypothetical protein
MDLLVTFRLPLIAFVVLFLLAGLIYFMMYMVTRSYVGVQSVLMFPDFSLLSNSLRQRYDPARDNMNFSNQTTGIEMSLSMYIYINAGFQMDGDCLLFYKGYDQTPDILYTPKCILVSPTSGAASDGPRVQIQVNNYEDTVPSTVVSTVPLETYKWVLLTVSLTQKSVSIYFDRNLVAYKKVPLIKFNQEAVQFYPTAAANGVSLYTPKIYNIAIDPNTVTDLINNPPPSNIFGSSSIATGSSQ